MGSKIVGFIFLAAALGAFFYLWQNALKNRQKIEGDEHEHDAQESKDSSKPRFVSVTMTPIIESSSGSNAATQQADEVNVVEVAESRPVEQEQDCADPIAKTQLEIAKQFFDMGDFEGAAELAQIVLENPAASADQTDKARAIIEASA